MTGDGDRAAPPDLAAISRDLEKGAKALRAWAVEEIKTIEARRDDQLQRLEQAVNALRAGGQVGREAQRPVPKQTKKRRRRRSRRPTTTPAAAQERREGIVRYLAEQDAPRSRKDIESALGLTQDSASNSLRMLREEGQIERIGNRSATRYRVPATAPHAGLSPGSGTVQGRIVQTLQERGWASLDELAQAIQAPRAEITKQCNLLVSEHEIFLTEHEGRSVYALHGVV